MSKEDVGKLLASIAAEDRELAAPDRVEARLVTAFRARRVVRGRRRAVAWGLAAAAAMLAVGAVARRTPSAAISTRPAMANSAGLDREGAKPAPPLRKTLDQGRKLAPSRSRHRAAQLPAAPPIGSAAASAPVGAPREVVTEFFPLMDPAPPLDHGAILRVRVPASAMQAVGLPVRQERLNDRVQADVVVGEEGLPRAIRFIAVPVR